MAFVVTVAVVAHPAAAVENSQTLFERYGNSIFQVKTIDTASGSQESIGSGFLIAPDIIATNYHVIAAAQNDAARHRIELELDSETAVPLTLLRLDVVNDLALLGVEAGALPAATPLSLAAAVPQRGEEIYSLGNPLDIGLSVVPGTYNGVSEHRLRELVHFSGAVNSGMSGGPALNAAGEVIGVNVATAGNQVSFLVPIKFILPLWEDYREEGAATPPDFEAEKRRQLLAFQQRMMRAVLDGEWEKEMMAGGEIYAEIAPFFECWGSSEEHKDIKISEVRKICSNNANIYLSDSFTTGTFLYQFIAFTGDDINPGRFYNYYSERIDNALPDNRASQQDVTNYRCTEEWTEAQAGERKTVVKSFFCAREYKNYAGLYDVFYVGANVGEESKGLFSHFTLAGVEEELALQFVEKFSGGVGWR